MKKLAFILLVFLFACAQEETIEPVYTSIEGWWTFSHKEASGGFEIVDYSGTLMVDNGPGNGFEIYGTEYQILERAKVNGTTKLEVFLTNSDKTNINLYDVEFNKDYTELTAKLWTYWHEGSFRQVNEPLKITR